MKLRLHRRYLGEFYTVGSLYINGEYLCDTIEDKVRDLDNEPKAFGETAIPYGTYAMDLSVSPKFKRVLPLINDVPNFTGIRIHRGNKAEDSHGCILPGENKVKGGVLYSTKYEMRIIEKILSAIKQGEQIWITIE